MPFPEFPCAFRAPFEETPAVFTDCVGIPISASYPSFVDISLSQGYTSGDRLGLQITPFLQQFNVFRPILGGGMQRRFLQSQINGMHLPHPAGKGLFTLSGGVGKTIELLKLLCLQQCAYCLFEV